jgi:hypothetical protein
MPSLVICPDAPLAFSPTEFTASAVTVVPVGTVQLMLLAAAGVGQSAVDAGSVTASNSANAAAICSCWSNLRALP